MLFFVLVGVVIVLVVMVLVFGEWIDFSDENYLFGLFVVLLVVFVVLICGLVLGLVGLFRCSCKCYLVLVGIVFNLLCLFWGWYVLSMVVVVILMVLG